MADIMIAVDLSPFSENVVSNGVALAKKMQAPVVLFSVVEIGIGIALPDAGPTVADDIPARMRETEERLTAFKNQYPDMDIRIVVTAGSAKNETLEQAHNGDTSYLVVGTHGRTGLDHMLMGSTAEYIIRHARIPVLVIPYNQAAH
ncbi:universal stress protein [Chitinophaga vietnamensis]|uniref:universal stress protein n=1 Tax=Chitinophaga vietnamensis TaxID=2593957 RepID=UPI00117741C2|nr:universal stress protein [Chitinophaga vietnamensis]